MPFYIIAKQTAIGQAILAQRLYHLVVVHLQSRVQDVNLILLLALVLIHAEADGKEHKHAADAKQQIALKGLTP